MRLSFTPKGTAALPKKSPVGLLSPHLNVLNLRRYGGFSPSPTETRNKQKPIRAIHPSLAYADDSPGGLIGGPNTVNYFYDWVAGR